jgi:hypothetical protein
MDDNGGTVGYKIVGRDGKSVLYREEEVFVYAVGARHQIPYTTADVIRRRGISFCRNPLDCLQYGDWKDEWLLLRLAIPAWARIESMDGAFAATEAVVYADVTDQVPSLLTGVRVDCRPGHSHAVSYRNGRMHRDDADEPAVVERTTRDDVQDRCVRKQWKRNGAFHEGGWSGVARMTLYREAGDDRLILYVDGSGSVYDLKPSDNRWSELYDVTTRVESFEPSS